MQSNCHVPVVVQVPPEDGPQEPSSCQGANDDQGAHEKSQDLRQQYGGPPLVPSVCSSDCLLVSFCLDRFAWIVCLDRFAWIVCLVIGLLGSIVTPTQSVCRSHLQVRFSDEKRFAVWNDGPVRVWRKDGDRFRSGYTRGSVKHSKAIMMHLVIEKGGGSRLTLCDPLQDSASYQATVLTPNLDFIKAGEYMHDGAPSHTSRSTVAFLAAKGVKVLPNWPPNSPDLNPVEHCWSWISQQLVGKKIRNANELEAAVRQAWAAKPADLIPKLYGSMVRRLTAVQVAKGAATKY